jgi:hypothetical protein
LWSLCCRDSDDCGPVSSASFGHSPANVLGLPQTQPDTRGQAETCESPFCLAELCPDRVSPGSSCVTLTGMASFQQRKATGDAHEQYVSDRLAQRRWSVSPWGQGTLTHNVRQVLRFSDSSIRWMPDLIAARGDALALIDCKSRMTSTTTNRHAVERAAVRAHLQLTAWTYLPVYYVFDNLEVLTPHDVLTGGRSGPRSRRGSGSAYYLISVGTGRHFDAVFGDLEGRGAFNAVA